MADYTLSQAADADLVEIYTYSFQSFGEAKADAYLQSLEESFQHLADQPKLGRPMGHIRKGYFRYEHASHSIFYKVKNKGVFIVRVLHPAMDSERHI